MPKSFLLSEDRSERVVSMPVHACSCKKKSGSPGSVSMCLLSLKKKSDSTLVHTACCKKNQRGWARVRIAEEQVQPTLKRVPAACSCTHSQKPSQRVTSPNTESQFHLP